jgi:hypothetical protein
LKITTLHHFKCIIAEIAILLTILTCVFEHFNSSKGKKSILICLAILAILSVIAYFDFGHYAPVGLYVNKHDFFHYYTGSKYFDEVGYYDLYSAVVVADAKGRNHYFAKTVRDQRTYEFVPSRAILKDSTKYIELFSPERWMEFKEDIGYFRKKATRVKWRRMVRDKGYNPTPAWTLVANVITNAAPTDSAFRMRLILLLDPFLIIAMLTAIYFAFGLRTMLFATIFIGINYMTNPTHIKGSLLRLDWMAMIVMSVCFIKLRCYKISGVMLGYAAMMRIFPVIFLFGMGGKAFWDIVKKRKISRKYIEFFLGALLTIIILFGASVARHGGTHQWETFFKKISMHNDDIVSIRVGFKHVFLNTYKVTLGSWDDFSEAKKREFADHKIPWWIIQALVLGITLMLLRRVEDYETIPLSFIPVFFLIAPTFYYYVMLVVPLLMFAPKLHIPSRTFGLAMFYVMCVIGYVLNTFLKRGLTQYFCLSWAILILCFCTAWVAYTSKPDVPSIDIKNK